MPDVEIFSAGDFLLQSGDVLSDAFIAYKTYGQLSAEQDNAILYPTFYMGTHVENEFLIGDDAPLSTERHFIIVPNMLGNGVSPSPGNTPPARRSGRGESKLWKQLEFRLNCKRRYFGLQGRESAEFGHAEQKLSSERDIRRSSARRLRACPTESSDN